MCCYVQGDFEPPAPLTEDQVSSALAAAARVADAGRADHLTAADILRHTLELLDDPARWVDRVATGMRTECYAFTADGESTWWGDPRAVRWCAAGARFLAHRHPAHAAPSPLPDWPAADRFDDTPQPPERIEASIRAANLFDKETGVHPTRLADYGHVITSLRRALAKAEAAGW